MSHGKDVIVQMFKTSMKLKLSIVIFTVCMFPELNILGTLIEK